MAIPFRHYKITDEEGKEYSFKHYPNQGGKVVTEKDEIASSLHARRLLLTMIDSISAFMSDNTICRVEIEEDKE